MFEKVTVEEFTANQHLWSTDYTKAYKGIQLPVRKTLKSAGYDFLMPIMYQFEPGKQYVIPSGLKCDFSDLEPKGNYALMLFPRSSLGFKYGMRLLNTIPVIDADYYGNPDNGGHILIGFQCDKPMALDKGEGFVQGVFLPMGILNKEIPPWQERIGGIGSTSK